MSELLDDLGKTLATQGGSHSHLVIAEIANTHEVIAIGLQGARQEGFPLPPDLYQAIIEIAEKRALPITWMQASFSMIVPQEKLPLDFFDDEQTTTHHGLSIHHLGRSGLKYLALFEAVPVSYTHLTLPTKRIV